MLWPGGGGGGGPFGLGQVNSSINSAFLNQE